MEDLKQHHSATGSAGTSTDPGDNEKHIGIVVEHASGKSSPGLPEDPDAHLSDSEKAEIDRKLLWKLDLQLIPWLCVLYLLSFLDRTNIGNAKIQGLQKSLGGMSTGRYNAALTIFFVSYALFEPLANILLKRLRPSIFIPIIMILWGACMLSMGFIKNWNGLMVARFCLGLTEAGLYPGVNYFLSCWYKRQEFGIRAAIFFSAAAVSGSFGGLLAAAISKMNGLAGLQGWAWIFVIEGLATILIGIVSFWLVHDFPDTATFLSEQDRARVIRRLKLDNQSSAEHEEFKMAYLYAALKDYKMYIGMFMFAGCAMPLYGFSLFLPSIITSMGYKNPTTAQLMSVPPYACAAALTIGVGFYADKTGRRGICNMVVPLIGIVGFALLLGSHDAHVKYGGTFLAALGIYPCIANTISWVSNNIEGVYKRGIVIGFVVGFGNLNGVVSSNIFFKAPQYVAGHGVILAYMTTCLLGSSLLMHVLLKRENAARRAGKRDHLVEGKTEAEAEAMGDMRPTFIYTI
ncbi:hypothetical protein HYALB_00006502 [Hymenoscyphus albidus]|uniref:Major facilitator superfamily (MFS) profile domain-containing protein n=1 Tax=Hymenoscyphus albidus TaxID=595503 RepID=A0A9N9Q1A7_9HELO|nr:hypothetical protein HYALB_00006502 [Hymenoscyphus albidus]